MKFFAAACLVVFQAVVYNAGEPPLDNFEALLLFGRRARAAFIIRAGKQLRCALRCCLKACCAVAVAFAGSPRVRAGSRTAVQKRTGNGMCCSLSARHNGVAKKKKVALKAWLLCSWNRDTAVLESPLLGGTFWPLAVAVNEVLACRLKTLGCFD